MKKLHLATIVLGAILIFGGFNSFASEVTEFQPIENQTSPDGGSKYGEDSATCVKNLSLYREYYSQWKTSKYKDDKIAELAVKPWRWCFFNCPSVSKNMYNHGVRLVKWQIKNVGEDTLQKEALIDTLMMIYTQRIVTYPNDAKYPEGKVLGLQAIDYFKYRKKDVETYYNLFDTSVVLMKNSSDPSVLKGYFYATEMYVKNKFATRDLVFDNYINIMDIINYNFEHIDTNLTNAKKAKSAINLYNNFKVVEKFVNDRIEKYATCEKLISYYGPKQEANPEDLDLARNIVKFFEMRKCTDSDLYFNALEKVHTEAPTAESALSMGNMAMKRKLYAKAKPYLIQATELFSDSVANKKGAAYLLLAEDLRTLKQYSAARTAALNVLKYKPNEGMAYIIIGDMYVSSAKDCKESGISISYWAAADKYQKAANISKDEKVINIARQKLSGIKKSFPETQALFMRNWTVGQTMQVGCWINETTTVRASN